MSIWSTFTAAPHRMMFFGGLSQLFLALAFWTVELAGRYTGWWPPLNTVVFSTWVHGWLMIYGAFPFLMFGFLMTTYPRWLGLAEISAQRYVPAFLCLAGGAFLVQAGLWLHPAVVLVGMMLHLAGWTIGLFALWSVYRGAGAHRDRFYETQLNAALSFGLIGNASFAIHLAGAPHAFVAASFTIGLWLFLVPVLLTVGHRMIPFFSSSALRDYEMVQPRWILPLMWSAVGLHVVFELSGLQAAQTVPDIVLFALGGYLTIRWKIQRTLGIPLLAALHIAFAWFAVGAGLYVVQDLTWLFTGNMILGRAPLHAITIGFVLGMVAAMVTRVSRGHSGRPLVMDAMDWRVFLGVITVALLRIGGEWYAMLNLLAVATALVILTPWIVRYVRIYLQPRSDGRPG